MPRTTEQNKEIREKSKNLILDAALKVFAEKGYLVASMSDIAKEANVSKGLAYNYFESKQKIVEAILYKVMEMFSMEYLPITKIDDPYKKLETMTDLTFGWLKKSHTFWRMIFLFLFQPGVIDNTSFFTHDFYGEIFAMLEDIFKQIGFKNYVAEARIYGAILDGAAIDYIADIENYPLETVASSIQKRYSKKNLELLLSIQ